MSNDKTPPDGGNDRRVLLRRAARLNGLLVGWNVLEGIAAVAFGLLAGSVALIGFGIDSGIEVSSAAVLLWRLILELRGLDPEHVEGVEQRASRIAGSLLLLLAVYITLDAGRRLLGVGPEPSPSIAGIILTGLSLIVMPIIGWAKLKAARQLGSAALRADAYETIACAWMSLATLIGLMLNVTVGWSWADPVAGLMIVPLIVHEGREALSGEHHHDDSEMEPQHSS